MKAYVLDQVFMCCKARQEDVQQSLQHLMNNISMYGVLFVHTKTIFKVSKNLFQNLIYASRHAYIAPNS